MRIAPLPHRTAALGAAVTALAVALCPGLALAGSSMDEIELKAHDGLPIIGMGTVVVIISVLFEKAQHLLLRRVSTRTVPVVNALFREWALLGFVGLLFFIFTQSGALESMSVVVFGEDQPLRLTHEVQRVDMVRARGAVASTLWLWRTTTLFLMPLPTRPVCTRRCSQLSCYSLGLCWASFTLVAGGHTAATWRSRTPRTPRN